MPRRSSGLRLSIAAVALALLFAVIAPIPASAARLPVETDQSQLSVVIPYLGTATRELPTGWKVTACPAGAAPNLVRLTCDEQRITFAGDGFADDVGEQQITISFTFNGAPESITYTVTLAPPRLQGPVSDDYGYPLGQGMQALIPFSDLMYVCEACTTSGPTYTTGKVKPKSAGMVSFSGTGLIFNPAPDFTGKAQLSFAVRDAFGQKSAASTITVSVVAGSSKAPAIVADTITVGVGTTAHGNALTNDLQDESVSTVLSSCGKPANGTVECKPDGSYVYTPDPGFTGIDQFSYHLFSSPTGDQATGSVIVGIGADPMPVLKMRPSAEAAPLMAPPIEHPDDETAKKNGVFSLLRDALTDAFTPTK